jgi:hypothetical protein
MASKQAHPGCLVLFGLIFAIMGSIPGCIALHDISTSDGTAHWVETTAVLLEVEQQHGGDTWSVSARYRYRAPDPEGLEPGALRDYEGMRVGVHSGSDNIGSWQQETYDRLHQAWKGEQPVPCWYDPEDPEEAVLDRSTRWELVGFMFIFPLVFGLAGGGIAWFGISLWRKRGQPAPDPVALAQQTVIRAQGGSGCFLWVFAIIWNAISWVAVVAVLIDGKAPWPVALLVGLFPFIGLLVLWAAVQSTVRRVRHGRPELHLDDGSWVTGQRVRATVQCRTAPQAGDRLDVRLLVVRSITSGSGKNRSTREHNLWTLDLAIDPQTGRDQGGLWIQPIELPLPSDLPPTADDVTWRLEWQLVRPGPDLSATFVLPVAAGNADGPELKALDLKVDADRAAPLAVLAKAGVQVGEDRGEVVLVLPAWRNPGLFITGLVCSALLSAGAVALFQEVGWWTALLSAPLVLLCWRGALRSALWRSRITLSKTRLTVAAGWWRIARHELKPSEIIEVERSTSMSTNDNAWFNMWLKTGDGARIAIARAISGPAAARIAEMIEAVRG